MLLFNEKCEFRYSFEHLLQFSQKKVILLKKQLQQPMIELSILTKINIRIECNRYYKSIIYQHLTNQQTKYLFLSFIGCSFLVIQMVKCDMFTVWDKSTGKLKLCDDGKLQKLNLIQNVAYDQYQELYTRAYVLRIVIGTYVH